jgi:hypothetical protein
MKLFLSYPKSGRTWIRFMINSYLCKQHKLKLNNVFQAEKVLNPLYPINYSHLTSAMIFKLPYYDMGLSRMNLNKISGITTIFLTRNIYATMASAYFQAKDRAKVFSGTPSKFIRDHRYGVIKLITFLNLFHEIRDILGPTTIISYEEFKNNPKGCLIHILNNLTIPIDDQLVAETIKDGEIGNMKKLAMLPAYSKTPLGPADPDNPNSYKARNGTNKESKKIFNEKDIAYISRIIDDLLLYKDTTFLKTYTTIPID